MRGIKFRGYQEALGYFVYGNYYQVPQIIDGQIFNNWIVRDDGFKYMIENGETIGQYTGLKDKNGKEIYEGDIYHMGDRNITYTVVWHDTGLIGKQNGSSSYAGLDHWKDRTEIIGNIYENGDLLG